MKKICLLFVITLFSIRPAIAQSANALDFDGNNDYVTSGLPAIFNNIGTQDFTMEAWIKPNDFSFSRILSAQLHTNSSASLAMGSGGIIFLYIENNGSAYSAKTTPAYAITLSQWNHVAVTWDASATTIAIYINGVLASTVFGGSASSGSINNAMAIGARTDGDDSFNGTIDELRIWNTVRTSAQINDNINLQVTLPQTELAAYYKFNQGTAGGSNFTITSLNDELNISNGVLHNFTLIGPTSNWVAGSVPLPLEWLEVKGIMKEAHEVELTWKVQEKNVANYFVEKSLDAKNFSTVSFIESSGDGIHEYSISDLNPTGEINYYRIKQIDKDGGFNFSKIILLSIGVNSSSIEIYPNPVKTILNVQFAGQAKNFQIFDATGRQVFLTAPVYSRTFSVNVAPWKPGIYFYQMDDKKGSFIKQ
jgi:hypothetical protein